MMMGSGNEVILRLLHSFLRGCSVDIAVGRDL
jgi:hypothetical protein